MNITIHRGNELSDQIVDDWQSICNASVRFANPFFHPQFTRTVAEVLPCVRVATLEDSGKSIGFFPHQLEAAAGRGTSFGKPVGGRLSDFQGLISNLQTPVDATQLLEGCGLRQIRFDHWLDYRPLAGQRFDRVAESPYMDLSNGYLSYYQRRTDSSSTRLKKVGQLSRKLAREVGPLVFNPDDQDPNAWQKLLEWKSNQYRRTGALDIFRYPWVPNLLRKLTQTNQNGFSGSVMTLRAGGRIAAVHAGIRTDRVVHWWFPAYDTDLSRYSPGLLMIAIAAEQLAADGCQKIDLGKGGEAYKQSLTFDHCQVAEGTIELGHWGPYFRDLARRGARSAMAATKCVVERFPGAAYLKRTTAFIHRRRNHSDFR